MSKTPAHSTLGSVLLPRALKSRDQKLFGSAPPFTAPHSQLLSWVNENPEITSHPLGGKPLSPSPVCPHCRSLAVPPCHCSAGHPLSSGMSCSPTKSGAGSLKVAATRARTVAPSLPLEATHLHHPFSPRPHSCADSSPQDPASRSLLSAPSPPSLALMVITKW